MYYSIGDSKNHFHLVHFISSARTHFSLTYSLAPTYVPALVGVVYRAKNGHVR